jgi:hypothetical protein
VGPRAVWTGGENVAPTGQNSAGGQDGSVKTLQRSVCAVFVTSKFGSNVLLLQWTWSVV